MPESSTQFPTHDAFPRPVAPLARGDETALGPALPNEAVPPPPRASWRTSTDTATSRPPGRSHRRRPAPAESGTQRNQSVAVASDEGNNARHSMPTLLPANGQCRAQARGATWKTGTQLPPALTLSRAVGDSRQMQPWVVEANRNGSVLS